jgi:hypothetical protein
VIHAHRYPYGMMVRGRNTAEAVPAGLAAVTVLRGPASARMAGRRRSQTPPATTPVVAGDKPDVRPRPARLAPAPALVQNLDQPVAQGPPVGVTVAATPSTSIPHPEALPATDE